MPHVIDCAQCGRTAELAKVGSFCSTACRARHWRERLRAQREQLATEAVAALRSGDVVELERVAHAAARLLAS